MTHTPPPHKKNVSKYEHTNKFMICKYHPPLANQKTAQCISHTFKQQMGTVGSGKY